MGKHQQSMRARFKMVGGFSKPRGGKREREKIAKKQWAMVGPALARATGKGGNGMGKGGHGKGYEDYKSKNACKDSKGGKGKGGTSIGMIPDRGNDEDDEEQGTPMDSPLGDETEALRHQVKLREAAGAEVLYASHMTMPEDSAGSAAGGRSRRGTGTGMIPDMDNYEDDEDDMGRISGASNTGQSEETSIWDTGAYDVNVTLKVKKEVGGILTIKYERPSTVLDHKEALRALDIPEKDKTWNTIPTTLQEPASWHWDPEIEHLAMIVGYSAGAILMDQRNLSCWTQEVLDEASEITRYFKEVFNDA